MNPIVSIGIADDEPDILYLFRLILEKRGFSIVYLARDGEEAVDRQRKTPADVVFLDYCMPFMDGLEASEKIKGEFPDTKVILMTCGEDIGQYVPPSADILILKKPFVFKAMIDMIFESAST
ncbi:MAG TPA: response regulator [Methanocella sp.]|uniref:response regulator transcription factor n=1 Tax=Methanocella sp. TaxID=2052833 RepID=UPI002C677EC6|nr:response regulator [Methanocella sp.]HTY89873.1 response regulator [Methanocella sp.]